MVEKPLHPFLEARQTVDRLLVDALAGEQRNKPDDRADAQRRLLPVDAELVVFGSIDAVEPEGDVAELDGVSIADDRARRETGSRRRQHPEDGYEKEQPGVETIV